MADQPHDSLFHAVFAGETQVLALIRGLLPPAVVGLIDFSHFVPAPEQIVGNDLSGRTPDRIFETRLAGREALLQFVVEHQAGSPAAIPVTVAGKAVRVLESWVRAHGTRAGIPIVITVVVYHGLRRWSAPRTLTAMTGMTPELRAALGPVPPEIGYVLVDLRGTPEAEIQDRVGALDAFAAFSLLVLKTARMLDFARRLLDWAELVRRVYAGPSGLDGLLLLLYYVLDVNDALEWAELRSVVVQVLGPDSEVSVMTLAERLRKEGEARGVALGEARGVALGEARGVALGEARGVVEGLTLALTRLLDRRFGSLEEEVRARLRDSDAPTIERWFDRAISAKTLEEVFEVR